MSKSGFKKMIAALCAAVLVAAATSAVALANAGGYETMKEALFQTIAVESVTMEAKASFKINDEIIGTVEFLSKANKDREYNKSIYADTSYDEFSNYDDETVTQYGPLTDLLRQSETLTDKQRRLISVLFDAFTGEMRNHVITSGNSVTVDLNESQIPELYQLIAGVSAESIVSQTTQYGGDYYDNDPIGQQMCDLAATKDFGIKRARAEATATDDGFIDTVKLYGEVGGRDDSGKYLSSAFELEMKLYDINNTEVPPLTDYYLDFDDSNSYYTY